MWKFEVGSLRSGFVAERTRLDVTVRQDQAAAGGEGTSKRREWGVY